eukprot:TRINITY_DN24785_c1_g2_i1.p1 TRINITY_DN24785_c1_g2~~TRINITY_DN24785_c1_g2_i1.p1  ORF type:complete len:340 (-),score=68.67 TRINITY_DN24785_c1_g2_i1:85-1104(-)
MGKKATPEPAKSPTPEPVVQAPVVKVETLTGEFIFGDGSHYSGQYQKKGDEIFLTGEGILQAGPEKFQGTFENGKYKVGTYTASTGAVYEGSFRDNLFHGVGEYRWTDGRVYRGTWKAGSMHGCGNLNNFVHGLNKGFMGFCLDGEFNSCVKEQAKARELFLKEYSDDVVPSASAALKAAAESATADGVLEDYIIIPNRQGTKDTKDKDKRPAFSGEDLVTGPFPEATAFPQALLQDFVAGLAEGAEKPLQVTVYTPTNLPDKKQEQRSQFGIKRLKRPQLQVVGQAIEFVAPDAEDGGISCIVVVNTCTEFDTQQAKWKLVYHEVIPAASKSSKASKS